MHTPLPIAAGVGIEAIIWIVILVFWGIAKLLQNAGKGKPRPGAPQRPASPMENELRDLLEQLAGQPPRSAPEPDVVVVEDEEEEPPAPVQPRPPPPPVMRRPPPVAKPAAQPVPPRRAPARDLPPPPDVASLPALSLRGEVVEEVAALKPASVSQVLNMRGMALHIPTGQTRHGHPALHPRELRHPQTLRQTMLARMILDPPRALERPGHSLSGV